MRRCDIRSRQGELEQWEISGRELGWLDEAEGDASTTVTKFFFEEIQTTRDYDPKDQNSPP